MVLDLSISPAAISAFTSEYDERLSAAFLSSSTALIPSVTFPDSSNATAIFVCVSAACPEARATSLASSSMPMRAYSCAMLESTSDRCGGMRIFSTLLRASVSNALARSRSPLLPAEAARSRSEQHPSRGFVSTCHPLLTA